VRVEGRNDPMHPSLLQASASLPCAGSLRGSIGL
jgi:hypothetical protein